MDDVNINFMNMDSIIYPEPHSKQPTLREAIEDLENDPEEVQMLLDFVQGCFQKKAELLPFSPPKHRKPDPEFIEINPKQSMFNMIQNHQTYLAQHLQ